MYSVLIAALLAIVFLGSRILPKNLLRWDKWIRSGCLFIAVLVIASTSFIYIEDDETGHLVKIYGAKGLHSGRIIAFEGEKGPQARILPPGFNFEFLLNIINDISKKPIIEIPEGEYGFLMALDGKPLRPDQTYADAVSPSTFIEQVNDAERFLNEGGQKGPQTSILTPGKYRLNHFLWSVQTGKVTDIPAGFVGVVKSNVYSRVEFGNLKVDKPKECKATHSKSAEAEELAVPLVPVGCIGIWETALRPGKYYINKKGYHVTLVDTRVQTWEYKGGYSLRSIDLTVEQQGEIRQNELTREVPIPETAVGPAVMVTVEGWNVPQELRVLVQVTPKNAPFVVASVGGLEKVESRILTPAIRSIVRNVGGGTIIVPVPILKSDGQPQLNANGEVMIKKVIRPTQVLDLIENRELIQTNVKDIIYSEGLKAGVEIKEIRLGYPSVPPELLVARRREQLAQQLMKAFLQEKKAQAERIKTEQARATAEKQPQLVEAEIEVRRSQEFAKARKNEGQGEKDKLELIARGQEKQVSVLGREKVVELRKYEITLKTVMDFFDAHPDVLTAALSNAHKFVPERVFTLGEGGANNLAGAAGILGDFLDSSKQSGSEQGNSANGQP